MTTFKCCLDKPALWFVVMMVTERVKKAAWRALENALEYLKTGNTLKFLFLPDGEGPDSYIREHSKAAFEQLVKMRPRCRPICSTT
ncbi:hypothetical protein OK016_11510 [Vibrio chagasii]|nr:hypothetical protein [Vibrio chagasii]